MSLRATSGVGGGVGAGGGVGVGVDADEGGSTAAAAAVEPPSSASTPTPTPPPAPTPPPTPEVARKLIAVGDRNVDDGGVLVMPPLELACLPAPDALTAPSIARARYDELSAKAGLPVGDVVLVLLTRDPSRSLVDPPPHLCRPVPELALFKAPFVRIQEPARRWMFRRIETGVAADTAALLAQVASKERAAAPPRVIVGKYGALDAVALPLASDVARPGLRPTTAQAEPATSRSSR